MKACGGTSVLTQRSQWSVSRGHRRFRRFGGIA